MHLTPNFQSIVVVHLTQNFQEVDCAAPLAESHEGLLSDSLKHGPQLYS